MSSDVSEFESMFRAAVCSRSDLSKIQHMVSMNEDKKPTFFKNKDADFIKQSLDNLYNEIFAICGVSKIELSTNNNNRLGNDIEEKITGKSFEIKLGAATDANLGIGIMEWSLDANGLIRPIMDTMKDRIEMYLSNAQHEDINTNRDKSKKDLAQVFKSKVTVGSLAPKRLTHTAICISHGITNEKEIINAYGSLSPKNNVYLMLINKNGKFNLGNKGFPYDESFIVKKADIGSSGGGAQLILEGSKSGKTIEFRQHFKNSYKDKSGVKIPASFWVKTPCFNVWIK